MGDFFSLSKQNWIKAFQTLSFRKTFIPGCILVGGILSSMPFFFQAIEKRNGVILNDWILVQLPPHNVSVPIFVVIWSLALLTLIRATKDPYIFLIFIWSYIFVTLLRAVSITFFPLNPPVGFVLLIDPLSNTFYGKANITKDLFFSGHTSTIFLMFLCLKKKTDKIMTLAGTIILTALLLIQHIHYAIDVLAAPFFTYLSYLVGKKVVNSPKSTGQSSKGFTQL
jgi:PAP2 superfamily C-terminal